MPASLLLGLLVALGTGIAPAEPGPRLGTLIDVEENALLVTLEDEPESEPQRIPLSAHEQATDWQPGMQVRIWSGAGDSAGARISPVGASASGADLTGVRRRLSRGSQGGRGSNIGGGRSGGRGRGGR